MKADIRHSIREANEVWESNNALTELRASALNQETVSGQMIPNFARLPTQSRYEFVNLVTNMGHGQDAVMRAFGVCRNTLKSALAWQEYDRSPLG
jgi:hypothetical protein